MNNFETYATDSRLIQMKALQVVYDFHALRHPGTHPPLIQTELTIDGVRESYLEISPEAALESEPSPQGKAEYIRRNYAPVMKAILREQPTAGSQELLAYCQSQIQVYDLPILGEPLSGSVDVDRILPAENILQAMKQRYAVQNARRCPPLLRFIASLS